MKATAHQDFNVKMVAQDVEALKICSDLKQASDIIILLIIIILYNYLTLFCEISTLHKYAN